MRFLSWWCVVLMLLGGCQSSAPPSPESAGPGVAPSSRPVAASTDAPTPTDVQVYRALLAADLDEVQRFSETGNEPPPNRTAFVFLREPADLAPETQVRSFIVARDAYFEVAEDGASLPGAKAMTALLPSGRVCVGQAGRRVVLRTKLDETMPPNVERGLVLEGCDVPPDVYGVLVVPGAHASARSIDATTPPESEWPSWAKGTAPQGVFRFDIAAPMFVVWNAGGEGDVEEKWQFGSATSVFGSAVVEDPTEAPTLLELEGRLFLLGGGGVFRVSEGSVLRVDDFPR